MSYSSKPSLVALEGEGTHGLAGREPLELGDLDLDHEAAARLEMGGDVAEALDLVVLGGQVGDGVVHEVGEPEGPFHPGRGEVTDRQTDVAGSRLRP